MFISRGAFTLCDMVCFSKILMIVFYQTQQGSDRQTKQECLELLQSSFEKHMIAYEVSLAVAHAAQKQK